jgi:hypothetical protein
MSIGTTTTASVSSTHSVGRRWTAPKATVRGASPTIVIPAPAITATSRVRIVPPSPAILIPTLTRDILDRQDTLIQLSAVCRVQGTGGFVDGSKLNKGVVALHIDSGEFSVRLKEHSEVFLFGCFFVKVDDK